MEFKFNQVQYVPPHAIVGALVGMSTPPENIKKIEDVLNKHGLKNIPIKKAEIKMVKGLPYAVTETRERFENPERRPAPGSGCASLRKRNGSTNGVAFGK
jgi:hypothetical protein